MGRGPGCSTATGIEGGERLNTGIWYWRTAVKYRSCPRGGGSHDSGGGQQPAKEGDNRGSQLSDRTVGAVGAESGPE